ncbi:MULTISPECIES: LuxR C-terminal-related transcriptional regulator [Lactonifactor]|uniref:LuxR C-terminal-related transcriptional regulator n=2 Tax=Clostridiaceae TaxID=31979 RepID=UPI001D03046B|nr:LuxR C-terminal-related transcriptional regulator [Lactonifactor longoviformis]MCB5713557.1 LuxR C-terminal-related transcriptional regulator [Lactonifactor longoviformis]MCB5717656.1 LuxR C-terminal-related transcriptional regulator [Lactonifactor longoviformis]
MKNIRNHRVMSVAAFSFLFAYLLSFVFEGQVLYSTIDAFGTQTSTFILAAIVAHFVGLFSCGFFIKMPNKAKSTMVIGMVICLIATVPFFFAPSTLWLVGLVVAGYAGGCAVAAWGFFLKKFTPKDERIKSCADVLIFSNIIMIAINVIAVNLSHVIGLLLSMLCLILGGVFTTMLPVGDVTITTAAPTADQKSLGDIKKPMLVLFLFVAVITVTSGLMYQVINPAFEHLTGLVSWYWAAPYIVALAFMRNLSPKNKAQRSQFLYIGMGMIVAAFITFMLLSRGAVDYLIVDTLMLGACGIFDLFWWSIIGETLDYSENPSKMFGIGLSANVLGVLCGDVLGVMITSIQLPEAEVAVIALTVVCITLVILPPLNRQLTLLLKSHVYLSAYANMTENQQSAVVCQLKLIDPLTERENEVLTLILDGKTNKEIAATMCVGESTVKYHVGNILSKYGVSSRAELISTLLKAQIKE